jgi:hypothetical protein
MIIKKDKLIIQLKCVTLDTRIHNR